MVDRLGRVRAGLVVKTGYRPLFQPFSTASHQKGGDKGIAQFGIYCRHVIQWETIPHNRGPTGIGSQRDPSLELAAVSEWDQTSIGDFAFPASLILGADVPWPSRSFRSIWITFSRLLAERNVVALSKECGKRDVNISSNSRRRMKCAHRIETQCRELGLEWDILPSGTRTM